MDQNDINWLTASFDDVQSKVNLLVEENVKLRAELTNTRNLLESRIFAVGIMADVVLIGMMVLIFILLRQVIPFD